MDLLVRRGALPAEALPRVLRRPTRRTAKGLAGLAAKGCGHGGLHADGGPRGHAGRRPAGAGPRLRTDWHDRLPRPRPRGRRRLPRPLRRRPRSGHRRLRPLRPPRAPDGLAPVDDPCLQLPAPGPHGGTATRAARRRAATVPRGAYLPGDRRARECRARRAPTYHRPWQQKRIHRAAVAARTGEASECLARRRVGCFEFGWPVPMRHIASRLRGPGK
mmetsp:Transcript_12025/g.34353  ORF Transcript_12025/g.34353 Transcript_12025/m.34353 type:complete len:218 (-) Transcript_12025:262-915(-)